MEDADIQFDMGMPSGGRLLMSLRTSGKLCVIGKRKLIGRTNIHSLPPACPQTRGGRTDGFTQSEDCLFAIVYTPLRVAPNANLPVFTW